MKFSDEQIEFVKNKLEEHSNCCTYRSQFEDLKDRVIEDLSDILLKEIAN